MKKTIFLFLIILFSQAYFCEAIRLTGAGVDPNPRSFIPGEVLTFYHSISDYRYEAEPYIAGELAQYAAISNIQRDGRTIYFMTTLSLPEELEGGIHSLYIGGKELSPPDAPIVGLARAQKLIMIQALYDEKIIDIKEFLAPNSNENESITFSINLESLSKQDINVWANIQIYDSEENLLRTLQMSPSLLLSGEANKILEVDFDTTGLKPGQYKAEAEIIGAEEIIKVNSIFNIGQLSMTILDVDKDFETGGIRKINLEVKNDWNGIIRQVHAILFLDSEEQIPTPSYNFKAFETKTLAGVIDLSNTEPGIHDLKVELHFEDETMVENYKINVTGELNLKTFSENKPFSVTIDSTQIMTGLIILVFILLLVIIFERRPRK